MFLWQQEDSPVNCIYEDGLGGQQNEKEKKQPQQKKQTTEPGMGLQAPEHLQYIYF